jgi:hypothetical protein
MNSVACKFVLSLVKFIPLPEEFRTRDKTVVFLPRFSVIINPVELCDDGEWRVSVENKYGAVTSECTLTLRGRRVGGWENMEPSL